MTGLWMFAMIGILACVVSSLVGIERQLRRIAKVLEERNKPQQ
jgi:hypothetical protein